MIHDMNLKLITMMKIYLKSLCSHDFIFANLARLKYVETKQAKESNVLHRAILNNWDSGREMYIGYFLMSL